MAEQKEKDSTVFSGGQDTPIDPSQRRTGTDARSSDAKSGAEPEAPGDKNTDIPGDPNQGTEAR
jgi:photosystem I subunit 4